MEKKELKKNEIGAIILAGGKSRRFGTDKALFPFQGKALIANVIEVVEKVTNDIIIITNSAQRLEFLPYPKYKDQIPNSGPLGGIYTGLIYARHQLNIVLPCDMPFISVECLKFLIENTNGNDITVPYHQNLLEPLCAVYSKKCLPIIRDYLDANNYQVFQFYDKVKTKRLLFDFNLPFYHNRLFFNINSQKDLTEVNESGKNQIHQ